MNSSLDLNLLLLARQGNGDVSDLPDLYAVTPPRRTARGRESDSLIIYLSMGGNSPLSREAHTQLLEQLAHKFYKTTGSLTAALRTVAEAVNLYLLDRNLRSTGAGRQGIGQLLLVALRLNTLYLVQCGAVHAYLVTHEGTQDLYDPQSSGRGLGISRSMPVRFLQIKMAADDYLVLSTVAAPGWSESTMKHPDKLGVEGLRRQLLENASQDFNTVIVQAAAGTGKLRMLRRKPDAPELPPLTAADHSIEPTSLTAAPVAEDFDAPQEDHKLGLPSDNVEESVPAQLPVEDKRPGLPTPTPVEAATENVESTISRGEQAVTAPAPVLPASQQTAPFETPNPQPVTVQAETIRPAQPASRPLATPIAPEKARKTPRPIPWSKTFVQIRNVLAPVITAILRALRSALVTIGSALLRLLKNLLPDAEVLRLPASTMVFIAIAIPLILAVIGGMVFLQRGRAQQQQVYYKQAAEKSTYAAGLTNPVEQRLAWQSALGYLNKAESYVATSQSQELRAQITSSLDALNAVKRLNFQQAIVGGLDSSVRVTRMVATTTDLYMLNATDGSVLHAIMTARGFEVDPNFQCGPTLGPINVGPLVDIDELPPGSTENASILGMDANGSLLYCIVGSAPLSSTLAPPNTGLGEPKALSIDRGDLYVLDPKVNAVWIYRNMEVSQQPRLFFGDTIPPMQDVIDLAVYNDDLFMLHADGHTTKCTYSAMAESPTRCEDPEPYSDNRPGMVHGPVIEDAIFNQIFFSSFPERSIYYLDPKNQAVYYFSVLLTLQWQFQPSASLAQGDASAFAISPNRTAFLAVGSYVYYAGMP